MCPTRAGQACRMEKGRRSETDLFGHPWEVVSRGSVRQPGAFGETPGEDVRGVFAGHVGYTAVGVSRMDMRTTESLAFDRYPVVFDREIRVLRSPNKAGTFFHAGRAVDGDNNSAERTFPARHFVDVPPYGGRALMRMPIGRGTACRALYRWRGNVYRRDGVSIAPLRLKPRGRSMLYDRPSVTFGQASGRNVITGMRPISLDPGANIRWSYPIGSRSADPGRRHETTIPSIPSFLFEVRFADPPRREISARREVARAWDEGVDLQIPGGCF